MNTCEFRSKAHPSECPLLPHSVPSYLHQFLPDAAGPALQPLKALGAVASLQAVQTAVVMPAVVCTVALAQRGGLRL